MVRDGMSLSAEEASTRSCQASQGGGRMVSAAANSNDGPQRAPGRVPAAPASRDETPKHPALTGHNKTIQPSQLGCSAHRRDLGAELGQHGLVLNKRAL